MIGRFSADGRLLEATMDPDSLPTYPALQMLKDQGREDEIGALIKTFKAV